MKQVEQDRNAEKYQRELYTPSVNQAIYKNESWDLVDKYTENEALAEISGGTSQELKENQEM